MIFCVTGNAHQPFRRLVDFSGRIARLLDEELIIQNGSYNYECAHRSRQVGILPHADFISTLCDASVIVTHAGAGTLRTLNSYEKRSICMPRLKLFDEHVNDHQIQIANEFMDRGIVYVPTDYNSLQPSALAALSGFRKTKFRFEPLSELDLNDHIVELIRSFLKH
jgi:beta-1,4-N-acetylglucosaminyltransferase